MPASNPTRPTHRSAELLRNIVAGWDKGAKDSTETNEVVGVVDGIRQKRLGGGNIVVSEVGLGAQR